MLNHSFFRHVFFPKPVAAVAGLSTASSVAAVSSAWTITVPGSTDASDWRTKGPAPQGSPRDPPGGSPRGSPRALGKKSTTVIKIGSLASFGWLCWFCWLRRWGRSMSFWSFWLWSSCSSFRWASTSWQRPWSCSRGDHDGWISRLVISIMHFDSTKMCVKKYHAAAKVGIELCVTTGHHMDSYGSNI